MRRKPRRRKIGAEVATNGCFASAWVVRRRSASRSRVRPSARETKFVQSFEIVGRSDEFPLPLNLANSPQQELPEAKSLLDDAEHRFDRAFAFAVDLSSGTCAQAVSCRIGN